MPFFSYIYVVYYLLVTMWQNEELWVFKPNFCHKVCHTCVTELKIVTQLCDTFFDFVTKSQSCLKSCLRTLWLFKAKSWNWLKTFVQNDYSIFDILTTLFLVCYCWFWRTIFQNVTKLELLSQSWNNFVTQKVTKIRVMRDIGSYIICNIFLYTDKWRILRFSVTISIDIVIRKCYNIIAILLHIRTWFDTIYNRKDDILWKWQK